jgi:hypothetical protein
MATVNGRARWTCRQGSPLGSVILDLSICVRVLETVQHRGVGVPLEQGIHRVGALLGA